MFWKKVRPGLARHAFQNTWRVWLHKEGRVLLDMLDNACVVGKTLKIRFTLTHQGLDVQAPLTHHQALDLQQILATFWVEMPHIRQAVLESCHGQAHMILAYKKGQTPVLDLSVAPLRYPWIVDQEPQNVALEFYNLLS